MSSSGAFKHFEIELRGNREYDPEAGKRRYDYDRKLGQREARGAFVWNDRLLAKLRRAEQYALQADDNAIPSLATEDLRPFLLEVGWNADEGRLASLLDRDSGARAIVTFRSTAPEMYALPWGAVQLGGDGPTLAGHSRILLHYTNPRDEGQLRREGPTAPSDEERGRILLAWAQPNPRMPVGARAFEQEFEGAMRASGHPWDRHQDLLTELSARSLKRTLDEGIVAGRPVRALHVLCHGMRVAGAQGSWGLAWHNDDPLGDAQDVIHARALGDILAEYKDTLRLVVLTACLGSNIGALGSPLGSPAQTIHAAGIPAVVASQFPLTWDGAAELTRVLYPAMLRDHEPVEWAFKRAIGSIAPLPSSQAGIDKHSLQLYSRDELRGDRVCADTRPISIRPYRGFEPLGPGDREFLVGRDADTVGLRNKVARLAESYEPPGRPEPRILVVHGPAGCGKSSLVRAGLIPAMNHDVERGPGARGETADRPTWDVALVDIDAQQEAARSPGEDGESRGTPAPAPVEILDAILAQAAARRAADGEGTLDGEKPVAVHPVSHDGDDTLHERLQRRWPSAGGRRLLVVVDALDPLLRVQARERADGSVEYTDVLERGQDTEALAFAQRLQGIAGDPELAVVVVGTLRDDLWLCTPRGLLTPEEIAPGLPVTRRTPLEPLPGDRLSVLASEPLRRVGLELDPELSEILLGALQASPVAMPWLCRMLDSMWLVRDGARSLDIHHYETTGNLDQQLKLHARATLDSMDRDARGIAQSILVRLVAGSDKDAAGARTFRCPLRRLGAPDQIEQPSFRHVLARLVDSHLVVAELGGDEGPVYRLAHRSLADGWEELRSWVAEARARIETRAARRRVRVMFAVAMVVILLGAMAAVKWWEATIAGMESRDATRMIVVKTHPTDLDLRAQELREVERHVALEPDWTRESLKLLQGAVPSKVLRHSCEVADARFLNDGRIVAVCKDGTLFLWSADGTASREILYEPEDGDRLVAWDVDTGTEEQGTRIVTLSKLGRVSHWTIAEHAAGDRIDSGLGAIRAGDFGTVRWLPDSSHFVLAGSAGISVGSADSTELDELDGGSYELSLVAVNEEDPSACLAAVDSGGMIKVWECSEDGPVRPVERESCVTGTDKLKLNALEFDPGSGRKNILLGEEQGQACVCSYGRGDENDPCSAMPWGDEDYNPANEVGTTLKRIRYSPDGRWIASATNGKNPALSVWSLDENGNVADSAGPRKRKKKEYSDIALSAVDQTSNILAASETTGDVVLFGNWARDKAGRAKWVEYTARFSNVTTSFSGDEHDVVNRIRFCPFSNQLLTTANDGTVVVWRPNWSAPLFEKLQFEGAMGLHPSKKTPIRAALDAAGHRVAWLDDGNVVVSGRILTGKARTLSSEENANQDEAPSPRSISIDWAGDGLVELREGNRVVVWVHGAQGLIRQRQYELTNIAGGVVQMRCAANAPVCVFLDTHQRLWWWDAQQGESEANPRAVTDNPQEVLAFDVSGDGRVVGAVRHQDQFELHQLHVESGDFERIESASGTLTSLKQNALNQYRMAISNEGQAIAIGNGMAGLLVFEAEAGAPTSYGAPRSLDMSGSSAVLLSFASWDETKMISVVKKRTGGRHEVHLWQLGRPSTKIVLPPYETFGTREAGGTIDFVQVVQAAWHPSRNEIQLVDALGTVVRWNLDGDALRASLGMVATECISTEHRRRLTGNSESASRDAYRSCVRRWVDSSRRRDSGKHEDAVSHPR